MVSKKSMCREEPERWGSGERYGDNYELPNATAYNETCAAIANVLEPANVSAARRQPRGCAGEKFWYKWVDLGSGVDGKSFSTNAMQIANSFRHRDMEAERSGWFECRCPIECMPPPAALSSGLYVCTERQPAFVNLFATARPRYC